MQIYFSHSYRDVEINSYFFRILRPRGFELLADQKSPIWCIAKLERYIHELTGFLSIVPRRAAEGAAIMYSPYIAYELSLARRSRVPRIMFVDDEVLNQHRASFPTDVVPFVRTSPESDRFRHIDAIEEFKERLGKRRVERRSYSDRSVTLVAADHPPTSQAIDLLTDYLRTKSYLPRQIAPEQFPYALNDVRLLEYLLTSELCVFLLDQRVTNADVLCAMAYAHAIPSMCFQYDPSGAEFGVVSGRLGWSSLDNLLSSFREQLDSYRLGFVQAVNVQDVESIGTTRRTPRSEQLWDPNDGSALIRHIDPNNARVRDIVNATRQLKGGSLVGVDPHEIALLLYGFVRTLHFAYEYEPATLAVGRQMIRTPDDIWNDNAATCLDLACFFASLFKAAGISSLIAILKRPNLSHALVGFRQTWAASWQGRPTIGDVRGASTLGEIVLIEPTGVVEHDKVVGGELLEERQQGNKTLEFDLAKLAAARLVQSQIELNYVFELPQ